LAKPKVYVTREIPQAGIHVLESYCDIEVNPEEAPPTKEELKKRVQDKDALLCLVTDCIDQEIINVGSRLKVISSMSVGYEHIDVAEATKRGIYVTFTPGVLTDATADFAWALIMATARRVAEADKYVRDGKWKIAWAPMMFLGAEIYSKTLGILGLGRIGSGVAERSKGFHMKRIYYDTIRAPTKKEKELEIQYMPLEEVLRQADFVSVHVPYLPSTHHLIGKEQIRMMKPNAHLINTSRGPVVDEEALAVALREGWIAGAGLDVFEEEPVPPKSPLLELKNIVLTPHIASATRESRYGMTRIAAENLISVLKGESPLHLVNPDVMAVKPLSHTKII
jgi:glyoxylate reductase